jgi:holo-[acyl-carrier protein] synthase
MGVGTDLVHVPRLEQALDRHPGFATRVYTPAEIAYCRGHREPGPRFAARFAAKEAVLKALGTGLARGMRWQDVEILVGPARRPLVVLRGAVAETAQRLGVRAVQVSLSHAGEYALACAVTEPAGAAAGGGTGDGVEVE